MQSTPVTRRLSATAITFFSMTLILLSMSVSAAGKDPSAKLSAFGQSQLKDVSCGQTGPIACGQTVSGTIDAATDCPLGDDTFFDLYAFEGEEGDEVRINLRSNDFDTFLFLLDPDSNTAETDDDGGNGSNSRINFTLDQDGTWTLAVNNFFPDDEGDYTMTLNCPNQGGGGGGGASFLVDKDTSGSWFPPDLNGQGWKIEILDDDTALLYWFTYPPQGQQAAAGDQAWMIGVGTIEGDTITFNLVIPTGPSFGPDFDPADVIPNEWGTFMIRFTGPDTAEAEYDGSAAGFGGGSFPDIQRLTSIASNTQTQKGALAINMGPGISGSWYDLTHDGEGWTIEVINEDTVLVYWFTYDEDGNQAWNIGIGTLVGNRLYVEFPVETTGTAFGAGFDSDDIVNPKWGTYIFTFDENCTTGSLVYQSDKGMGGDVFNLTRLTSLKEVPCMGFNPNAPSSNTIATNPGDPLLLSAKRPDDKDISVFGNRDNSGLANNLGQIKSKNSDDKDVSIQVGNDNRPEDIVDEDTGTSIGVEETPGGFVINTTSANGDVSTQIQVTNAQTLKQQIEERRNIKHGGPTRSGSVYAVYTPATDFLPPLTKGATDSSIEVRRCGSLVDDALVDVRVDGLPGGTRTFSAFNNGGGRYTVTYPTSAASADAAPSSQQCGRVVEVFGQSCNDTLAELTFDEVLQACNLISGNFEPFSEDFPGIAGTTLVACVRGLSAVVDYCGISGLTADDAAQGGLSPDDYVCDNVAQSVDNALDDVANNVTITPVATLPGRQGIVGQSRSASTSGPFPDFSLDAEGDVEIAGFRTIPGDPQPGESYEARADLDCASQGTEMTISVEGTDGFTDSDTCVFVNGGSGSCSLFVPGGGQGVRDTITVEVLNGPSRTISIVF